MKIGLKKWIALLLAAALLLTAAACSLEEKSGDAGASAKDRARVAANVGGKYDITKGELIDQYDYLLSMYSYYGMAAPTADADIESLQDSVLAEIVNSKILLYQATEQGITLDEAQQKEVEATLDEEMQYWIDAFTSEAQTEGAADVDARMRELFDEALAGSNMDLNMEGYREYLREMIEQDALIAALEASVKAEVTVTEEEIQEYYDNLLDIQKEDYDETPGNYATDAEAFVMSGGNPVIYAPKGYMRVKTITVSPEAELSEEYTTLRTALDALEAEYGRLMLDGMEEDAERIAEIKAEYDEKKAEADELY
ncbi:MAG: peptidylprolyl isomerase [Firmicutes bacterium ADurb.Bin248]|nr:MAG: peptidylprolyl isomerase [Firmicutes bacterium ADurb.Bin248]